MRPHALDGQPSDVDLVVVAVRTEVVYSCSRTVHKLTSESSVCGPVGIIIDCGTELGSNKRSFTYSDISIIQKNAHLY